MAQWFLHILRWEVPAALATSVLLLGVYDRALLATYMGGAAFVLGGLSLIASAQTNRKETHAVKILYIVGAASLIAGVLLTLFVALGIVGPP